MPFNDRLFKLLAELEDKELRSIWVDALRCRPEEENFLNGSREWRMACISQAWRSAHGHTLRNLTRSPHDLPWKAVLVDVADKLKPGLGWTHFKLDDGHTEEEIEAYILRMNDERIRTAWSKMSADDKERLARSVDAELKASADLSAAYKWSAAPAVTAASLGNGISAGLLTGAGALALMQGSGAALVGGLLGGTLYQVGLWVVIRVLGYWSGAQLVASGGAAAVGGAVLSAPAAIAFAANAVMSTSYSKTIPATLMVLTAHEVRRQLAALDA